MVSKQEPRARDRRRRPKLTFFSTRIRRYNGLTQGAIQCPDAPETCAAPLTWYPQLSEPLGAPLGPAVRSGSTWRRQFEHASVLLDLDTPDNSGVVFSGAAGAARVAVAAAATAV